MFSRFDTMSACDEQADGRTDGHTSCDGINRTVIIITRGQSNLAKSASRGAHSPVRGHPRGSKFVPLNSWGRVSY